MNTSRSLNVLWRRNVLDQFIEAAFIRDVVLAGVNRPVRWIAIEDAAELPLLDDLLVCSFGDSGNYLRALRADGRRNIGVFHLGDETGSDGAGFYGDADYVLRHYHHPASLTPPGGHCHDVAWVPNGWAGGVGPQGRDHQLAYDQRRHGVFFAGYAGGGERDIPERAAMLAVMQAARIPATVILSQGFGQGLGRASYAAYLGDTQLALIPAGNAPETIRLYDALELGAVPVIIDRPWLDAGDGLGLLGPPPVARIAAWEALPDVIAEHAAKGVGEARRRDLAAWWQHFKLEVSARVGAIIEGAFARTA